MDVYEVSNPALPTRVPAWRRTFLLADDGQVFVPAAMSPDGEQFTMLAASWDATNMTLWRKHVFLPLAWMQKEYGHCPQWAELYRLVNSHAEKALQEARSR